MKRVVFFLGFALALGASRPLLREVYSLQKYLKFEGKFYFTPMAEGPQALAFGYVSKVKPTEEELKAARERLKRIVDEGIRRQYGSYERYYKEMERVGEEAGEKYRREAPAIIRDIMPPSLIKEAVPFFMKAMVLMVRNLPYVSTPIGNFGETGVVILKDDLSLKVISLGINEPVEDLEFSPDGRLLGVLSDMSYEDEKGKLHILGKVSLVEVETGKVLAQWIFREVRRELHFTPDGKLALLYYPLDGKRQRKIFFINLETLKIEDQALPLNFFNGEGKMEGISFKEPIMKFSPGGKYLTVMLSEGILQVFSYPGLKPLFKIKAGYGPWFFSPEGKYLLTSAGELWDLSSRSPVGNVARSTGMKRFAGIFDALFAGDYLYITDRIGFLRKLSLPSLRQVASSVFYSRISWIKFSPDGRYIVSLFRPLRGRSLVSYGKRLRVRKNVVKVLDGKSFELVQVIEDLTPTALNHSFLGEKLIVSDFEGLRVYERRK